MRVKIPLCSALKLAYDEILRTDDYLGGIT